MQQSQEQIDRDEDGNPLMTLKSIKYYCLQQLTHQIPQLNDKLNLSQKGFQKIRNLGQYSNLVSLYLNNNKIQKIEGLQPLTNLVCLYLNNNNINKIQGLLTLKNLQILNLSTNQISTVEGLQNSTSLKNINVSFNRFSNPSSITNFQHLHNLTTLDLSNNSIQQSQDIYQIVISLTALSYLNIKQTPFVKKYNNCKKKIIGILTHLKFFDDRPVLLSDHRICEAFLKEGIEGEKKEKRKIQQENIIKQQIINKDEQLKDNSMILPKVTKQSDINKTAKKVKNVSQNKVSELTQQIYSKQKKQYKQNQVQQNYQQMSKQLRKQQQIIQKDEKQKQIQAQLQKKWKHQYNQLLSFLLDKYQFDFQEMQPQFNMIISKINKKLKTFNHRFQIQQLQQIWTLLQIQTRNNQKV